MFENGLDTGVAMWIKRCIRLTEPSNDNRKAIRHDETLLPLMANAIVAIGDSR